MKSAKEILYTANLNGSLKLSASGDWYHNGVRFKNTRLAKLFHRSIVWDKNEKQYFIEIGQQRAKFDLEDTANFVISISDESEPWLITLADDSIEEINCESMFVGPNDQIYCQVKDGQRAVFTRQAYQQIARHVVDEEHIKIGSNLVCLKKTDHPNDCP